MTIYIVDSSHTKKCEITLNILYFRFLTEATLCFVDSCKPSASLTELHDVVT